MSLVQLRSFVEVYRRRSLSDAARALSLTQPAISQHIASLEAQLARPLFDRHSRGVRPTAIADDLAALIGTSLDTAESALAAVRARSARLSGTIHLAAPAEYLAEHLAPRLTPLVEAGLDLRLHSGGREALYAMLGDGRVHLGVTASRPDDPRLDYQHVGEETLHAMAAPQLAQRARSEGVGSVPYLSYDLDRPLLRTWLDLNRVEVEGLPVATAPDLRALRAMMRAGIGWSVLPGYLTEAERAADALIEIPAPIAVPRNQFYLVWARSALRHPRVATAKALLLRVLGTA